MKRQDLINEFLLEFKPKKDQGIFYGVYGINDWLFFLAASSKACKYFAIALSIILER